MAKYDGFRVHPNKLVSGPLYGHCIPQSCFAVESVLEDMGEELGYDPVDFKNKFGKGRQGRILRGVGIGSNPHTRHMMML